MKYISLFFVLLIFLSACLLAETTEKKGTGYVPWTNYWIYGKPQYLPRVLLIGDSITWGYAPKTDEYLKDRYIVDRMATAAILTDPFFWKAIDLVLSENRYDIITFNYGLHGGSMDEKTYRECMEKFADRLSQTGAKLIYCTTTPCWDGENISKIFEPDETGLYAENTPLAEKNNKVILRNKAAKDIMKKRNIAVIDLYSLVNGVAEYRSNDGVHYNQKGYEAMGKLVADSLL